MDSLIIDTDSIICFQSFINTKFVTICFAGSTLSSILWPQLKYQQQRSLSEAFIWMFYIKNEKIYFRCITDLQYLNITTSYNFRKSERKSSGISNKTDLCIVYKSSQLRSSLPGLPNCVTMVHHIFQILKLWILPETFFNPLVEYKEITRPRVVKWILLYHWDAVSNVRQLSGKQEAFVGHKNVYGVDRQ